jgi:hypothetical protein
MSKKIVDPRIFSGGFSVRLSRLFTIFTLVLRRCYSNIEAVKPASPALLELRSTSKCVLKKATLPDLSNREYNLFNIIECSQRRQEGTGMANQEHLDILKQGVKTWNRWRIKHPEIYPDLSGADLTRADLNDADLIGANLIGTNFAEATLTNCNIYGISAWSVELKGATQNNLVITPSHEPTITVDNLKIAQFIYLLLNNEEIRDVINTITTKVVLILGRFTPERKAVLDELRDALRLQGFLPILFDFERPASRDITETVSTLAHLARFVIADITDAKSIPQELMIIVPNLPSVPVQPLILESQHEYGMFEHFMRFPWVLPVYRYTDEQSLLQSLQEKVITPAEQKAKELEKR